MNTLVALAVLSIVSLVRDFRRRAELAPMVPDTSGQRNFTPLLYQLAEQESRAISPVVLTDDPEVISDEDTDRGYDPDVISDDETERGYDPAE